MDKQFAELASLLTEDEMEYFSELMQDLKNLSPAEMSQMIASVKHSNNLKKQAEAVVQMTPRQKMRAKLDAMRNRRLGKAGQRSVIDKYHQQTKEPKEETRGKNYARNVKRRERQKRQKAKLNAEKANQELDDLCDPEPATTS